MYRLSDAVLVVTVLMGFLAPLPAQEPGEMEVLKEKIDKLEKGQTAIRKDLADIKRLLQASGRQAAAGPTEAVLDLTGKPFKGESGAGLVMVEFSDYQ